MSRARPITTDRQVQALKLPGRYGLGGHNRNLYLVVDRDGNRRWVFRFTHAGVERDMGLGSYLSVTFAAASRRAAELRAVVADGRNPIEVRRAQQAIPTFGEVANDYLAGGDKRWKNPKHAAQWRTTLEKYAAPLWTKPVNAIATADVYAVLEPIWNTKRETASRLRGRIETVLDTKAARQHRTGPNPAEWRGNLKADLGEIADRTAGAVKHHAAMPYADVPAFLAALRARQADAALALELTILTAARSGETLGATWEEFDLERALWAVPGERMKAGKAHVVPLPAAAVALLQRLQEVRGSSDPATYVFPSTKPDTPLSNMAMAMLLRRMGKEGVTVHGFRSAFRDWCGDKTSFPREVAEAALAHATGDETEVAYRRGSALEKRRQLMRAWADYCGGAKGGNVVALRA